MALPTCVVDNPQYPRTYVVQVQCEPEYKNVVETVLKKFAKDQITMKPLPNAGLLFKDGAFYLLVTELPHTSLPKNRRASWKHEVAKQACPSSKNPHQKLTDIVTKVTALQFDRRMQRYFGWGDAFATREDVVAACKKGDKDALIAMLPESADLVEMDSWDLVPALYEKAQGAQLALTYDGDNVQHEVGQHQFGAPVKKAECTICNELYAMVCSCGMQRCQACVPRPVSENYIVYPHPVIPEPFFVMDVKSLDDKDKKAWILEEIGTEVGQNNLIAFATKFEELFGSLYTSPADKKRACLKTFSGRPYKSYWDELDVQEKEDVNDALNITADRLCHGCHKALPAEVQNKMVFYHKACEPRELKNGKRSFSDFWAMLETRGYQVSDRATQASIFRIGFVEYWETFNNFKDATVGGNPKRRRL